MLKKNKLSFPSYWLPVMLIGFVPHSGYGDETFTKPFTARPHSQIMAATASSTPPAAANAATVTTASTAVTAPVPTAVSAKVVVAASTTTTGPSPASVAAQPAVTPKQAVTQTDNSTEPPDNSGSTQKASTEKAGILSLADAQNAFGGNLQIVEQQKDSVSSAYLEGVVPNACLNDIQIRTTARFPEISSNSADGTSSIEGFSIHDNGQLISCMHQNDCSDENTPCTSLSKIQTPITLDHSKHVHLSYFAYNRLKGNLDQGAWSAFDMPGTPADTKSTAEIDAAAKQAAAARHAQLEKYNMNMITSCAKSPDGIEQAKILAQSLDPADQTTALGIIAKQEANLKTRAITDQEKAIATVEKKIDAANVKVSDLDDLEDNVYSINDKLTDMNNSGDLKDADYNKLENRLVADIQKMVDVRLTDDDANQESIDRAKKMLDRVINGDDDDDTSTDSLHPTNDVLAGVEKQMNYDLPRATVSAAYMSCLDDTIPGSKTAASYKKDCTAYMKDASNTLSALEKQKKKDKCVESNGLPNPKLDKDKDLSATCAQIDEAESQLQEVPQQDQQVFQAQMQQLQKQQQTMAAQQQRPGVGGQTGLPQMGSVPTPSFSNPMMAGGAMPYQSALGPNPAIYSGNSYMPGLTVPMSSMMTPGSTSFNPYMGVTSTGQMGMMNI
jgi:hypothetical protein